MRYSRRGRTGARAQLPSQTQPSNKVDWALHQVQQHDERKAAVAAIPKFLLKSNTNTETTSPLDHLPRYVTIVRNLPSEAEISTYLTAAAEAGPVDEDKSWLSIEEDFCIIVHKTKDAAESAKDMMVQKGLLHNDDIASINTMTNSELNPKKKLIVFFKAIGVRYDDILEMTAPSCFRSYSTKENGSNTVSFFTENDYKDFMSRPMWFNGLMIEKKASYLNTPKSDKCELYLTRYPENWDGPRILKYLQKQGLRATAVSLMKERATGRAFFSSIVTFADLEAVKDAYNSVLVVEETGEVLFFDEVQSKRKK
jgi:hypothetical protein